MTFDQYWSTLIKRWKLIVSCFVVIGLGTFIGSKLMTPIYQSAATVRISISAGTSQADINNLLASDQLVQTEAQLATSYQVLSQVAAHYPGLTVDELTKNVTSVAESNTQLFQITVADPSPSRAAALANDIAGTLIKQENQVNQQINAQSQQQIQQDLQRTQQQIDSTSSQLAALQSEKGSNAQISTLNAQLSALREHYTQWQSLLAQVELTEAQSGNTLRIAQPAQPASSPARPNVLLNTAIGLLVGLLNGLLLAMLFEQLDTRVRTEEALTQLVDWPVLAKIWNQTSSKKDKKDKNTIGEEMVNPPPHSPNVESYRILRTNIGFSMVDKSLHSMMVVSAQPQDGKSTVAANLAIFMAKAGKKTLLIDADLRRPTQSKKFHLPTGKSGLSNAIVACSQLQFIASTPFMGQSSQPLSASFSLEPYLHSVDIPNLRVMPSGPMPPNPPELLDSKAMERFFTALAGSGAEVIIFDTPPLIGLSDASILASKVDGVLVVVDVTTASKKNLKQMKALLLQSGSRVLGCVMNKHYQNRNDNAYSYYYQAEEEDENNENRQNKQVPASPATVMISGQR
ncbi:MAG: Wzz/FepE/Etk N-terminal domain-containing protein [Ktedonobacteraceae bacterium]